MKVSSFSLQNCGSLTKTWTKVWAARKMGYNEAMWEECRQRCNNWFSDASNSASPDSLKRHKVSLVGEETRYPFLGTRPRLLHVAVAHSQSYTIPTPCPVIPAGVVNYRLHFPAGPAQPMKGRRFNTESSRTLTWGPEISYTFQMLRKA